MLPGFLCIDQRAALQGQFSTNTMWTLEVKLDVQAAFPHCYLLRPCTGSSLPSLPHRVPEKEKSDPG